jgi:hypothetical protein
MRCQACGASAPTKYVAFYQNIGALILRFSKSIQGELCKSCIHKHFWEFTSITLLVGWLGTVSFIIAPFIVLNNIIRYLGCLTMPSVETPPQDAESEYHYAPQSNDEHNYTPQYNDASVKGDGSVKEECYLCGRRLQADERQERVCQLCRT